VVVRDKHTAAVRLARVGAPETRPRPPFAVGHIPHALPLRAWRPDDGRLGAAAAMRATPQRAFIPSPARPWASPHCTPLSTPSRQSSGASVRAAVPSKKAPFRRVRPSARTALAVMQGHCPLWRASVLLSLVPAIRTCAAYQPFRYTPHACFATRSDWPPPCTARIHFAKAAFSSRTETAHDERASTKDTLWQIPQCWIKKCNGASPTATRAVTDCNVAIDHRLHMHVRHQPSA
jgi:hypothetical protein